MALNLATVIEGLRMVIAGNEFIIKHMPEQVRAVYVRERGLIAGQENDTLASSILMFTASSSFLTAWDSIRGNADSRDVILDAVGKTISRYEFDDKQTMDLYFNMEKTWVSLLQPAQQSSAGCFSAFLITALIGGAYAFLIHT